jgi:hypothetical protein
MMHKIACGSGHNTTFAHETDLDLTDGMLVRALKDARQTRDRRLQQEALAWLQICCPDVVDELDLASLGADDAKRPEVQTPPTTYSQKYAVFSLA